MSNVYLESAHRLDFGQIFWNPEISIKKAARGKHSYTYIGSGYLKDPRSISKFGKILALFGELFLILLSVGSLLISKSFRNLIEHTWKSLKDGTELGVTHVFISNKTKDSTKQESPAQKNEKASLQKEPLDFELLEELIPEKRQDLKLSPSGIHEIPVKALFTDNFTSLPPDMKKIIINQLDSDGLLALSKTNKANADFVLLHFPKKLLAANALRIWKANPSLIFAASVKKSAWNKMENDHDSYSVLMNHFPKEVTQIVQDLLRSKKPDPFFLVLMLSKRFMINHEDVAPLLRMAKEKSDSHTLELIALLFVRINPEFALSIAENIKDSFKTTIKYFVALHYLSIDPNKSSEIMNTLKMDQIDYRHIFDLIDTYDEKFYLQFVPLLENSTIQNIMEKEIFHKSKINIIKAFIETQQFSKAKELLSHLSIDEDDVLDLAINVHLKIADKEKSQEIAVKFFKEAIKKIHLEAHSLVSKKLYMIGIAYFKISPEKTRKIFDRTQLARYECEKPHQRDEKLEKEAREESLLEQAEAYAQIKPEAAKEILSKIPKQSYRKVQILLKLVNQTQKNDAEALKLLEEAYTLADQIPWEEDYFLGIEYKLNFLSEIAKLYAYHNSPEKIKQVYENANSEIEKLKEKQEFDDLILYPHLAKIAILINPAEAIRIVNKNLDPVSKINTFGLLLKD